MICLPRSNGGSCGLSSSTVRQCWPLRTRCRCGCMPHPGWRRSQPASAQRPGLLPSASTPVIQSGYESVCAALPGQPGKSWRNRLWRPTRTFPGTAHIPAGGRNTTGCRCSRLWRLDWYATGDDCLVSDSHSQRCRVRCSGFETYPKPRRDCSPRDKRGMV